MDKFRPALTSSAARTADREARRNATPGGARARSRRHNLSATLRRHNVTMDEYLRQLEAQNGTCAICGSETVGTIGVSIRRLCIDHDHGDEHFRALLCDPCNRLLGVANDSIELLQAAILYLQTH
jgi:hypothetical protein